MTYRFGITPKKHSKEIIFILLDIQNTDIAGAQAIADEFVREHNFERIMFMQSLCSKNLYENPSEKATHDRCNNCLDKPSQTFISRIREVISSIRR